MARRPIYPRTPQQNAIDKLLNQTIPQLISAKEAKNERDEQRAESLRRYEEGRKERFADQQERRMLYVDNEMNEIETLLADGDLAGYDARVERLGEYTDKYGITVNFNTHDFIEKGKQSADDHKKFGDIRKNFYLATNPTEVVGYLDALETLASTSPYITEREIAWAFEDIQKHPDREQYKGLSGVKLDPKKWSADARVRASYHSNTATGETSGGLWTQAHVAQELQAMDAEYFANLKQSGMAMDNLMTAESYYTSLGMDGMITGGPFEGMTVKQAINKRLEGKNSSTIQNMQQQYWSHFQESFNGNFRNYAFDDKDNLKITEAERNLIDTTTKHWAYVELYGPARANEIKRFRNPTPLEQLKAEELRRDRLGFPQEYVDFAQEEFDKSKTKKEISEEDKKKVEIQKLNFNQLEDREDELIRKGINEGIDPSEEKELKEVQSKKAEKKQLEVKSIEEVENETQEEIDTIQANYDRYQDILRKSRKGQIVTSVERDFVENYPETMREFGITWKGGAYHHRKAVGKRLRDLRKQKDEWNLSETGDVARRKRLDKIERDIANMRLYKKQKDGSYKKEQWGLGKYIIQGLSGVDHLYDDVISEKEYKERMKSLQKSANKLRKEFKKESKEA